MHESAQLSARHRGTRSAAGWVPAEQVAALELVAKYEATEAEWRELREKATAENS